MADKIQATQINNSSSSWYQRLRNVQSRWSIPVTSDPNIIAGTKATYNQYNNFVQTLIGLKSDKILKDADWRNSPPIITANTQIKYSTQQQRIENILNNLETLNANFVENGDITCNDTSDSTCMQYGENAVQDYHGDDFYCGDEYTEPGADQFYHGDCCNCEEECDYGYYVDYGTDDYYTTCNYCPDQSQMADDEHQETCIVEGADGYKDPCGDNGICSNEGTYSVGPRGCSICITKHECGEYANNLNYLNDEEII